MYQLVAAIFILLFSVGTIAKTYSEEQLVILANEFVTAKNARQQPDTTEQDVEHYISLLADEFIDEHVKFGVTITSKAELRKGMIAKMADEIIYSSITINQTMTGANVVMIKMTEEGKGKDKKIL